jgi:hypothetical protein
MKLNDAAQVLDRGPGVENPQEYQGKQHANAKREREFDGYILRYSVV